MKPKARHIITDKRVLEQTGSNMEEWFLLLDKKGAKKGTHHQIFELISGTEGLKPLGQWNHNLLATTYEWSRGLKERGEKENGFEISVSKTIAVPVSVLYAGLVSTRERNTWLKEKITIRKATENKSARVTWEADQTSLSIDFYEKAADKSQIVVQHMKIADSVTAAAMKIFWSEKLNALKTLLET